MDRYEQDRICTSFWTHTLDKFPVHEIHCAKARFSSKARFIQKFGEVGEVRPQKNPAWKGNNFISPNLVSRMFKQQADLNSMILYTIRHFYPHVSRYILSCLGVLPARTISALSKPEHPNCLIGWTCFPPPWDVALSVGLAHLCFFAVVGIGYLTVECKGVLWP